MKELSIEEKAKAYDRIIEKANKMHYENCEACQICIEELIPELAESEDEKIRKYLIKCVNENMFVKSFDDDGFGKHKVLAWLEKQREQILANPAKTCKDGQKPAEWHREDEQNLNACLGYIRDEFLRRWLTDIIHVKYDKPADKAEPKFKVGDWVVYNRNDHSREIMQIYDIKDGRYYFTDNVHFSWSIKECDEKSHPWSIEDAKDGDVLCCESGWTCIFKALDNHTNAFSSHCFMDSYKWFCNTGSKCHTLDKAFIKTYNREIHPATKEQRDLLFQKMCEAGYEWDAEKKELRKIEQNPWSEEDEKIYAATIFALAGFMGNEDKIDWLKSLKDRVQPQPKQEWSKEDEEKMVSIFLGIETFCPSIIYGNGKEELLNWLKSRRPQNRWISVDKEVYVKEPVLAQKKDKSDQFEGIVVCCDHTLTPNVYERYMILGDIVPQKQWKPSDEQIEALDRAQAELCSTEYNKPICDLIDSLKKLREE